MPLPPAVPILLDVAAVLVFAATGRASHHEGDPVMGTLRTAAPFLAGLAFGWFLSWSGLRRWPRDLTAGAVVVVATVGGGMLVRTLTDQGTRWSFVLVATLFLGAVLLGWRAVRGLVVRRRG